MYKISCKILICLEVKRSTYNVCMMGLWKNNKS